jgi:hypothetical protein
MTTPDNGGEPDPLARVVAVSQMTKAAMATAVSILVAWSLKYLRAWMNMHSDVPEDYRLREVLLALVRVHTRLKAIANSPGPDD